LEEIIMRLRILMLALVTCLAVTEVSQAQVGFYGPRGGGVYAGWNPGFGISVGVPRYYGYGAPYYYGYAPNYNGSPYYYYGSPYPMPSAYTYAPVTTSMSFFNPARYVYVPTVTSTTPVYLSPAPTKLASVATGLQIRDVIADGAASKSHLRRGDIITAVGSRRTETFEDLQQALNASNGTVEVTFVNMGTMKTETTLVTPEDGKIGVTVVPVYAQ
jgi:membrane-associated protease RseP (regulator of RpoE activity)